MTAFDHDKSHIIHYKKKVILKTNFKDPSLVFPISVKSYKVPAVEMKRMHLELRPNPTGEIDFSTLTGNEILLAMMDAENFSDKEMLNCLRYFTSMDEAKKIDWTDHEIF